MENIILLNEKNKLPKHVSIIMDGNRRWAKSKKLPIPQGHKAGSEALKIIIRRCIQLKIPYLTVYAFSSENWSRPKSETDSLLKLLKYLLNSDKNKIIKNGIKINFIGNLTAFSHDIQSKFESLSNKTKDLNNLTLSIAINYGSRLEIVTAINKILKLKQNFEVTEENFSKFLYTYNIPDPDLVIRTGGAKRLSNFLLWQSSYTEFYFTKTLWPEFNNIAFDKALIEYSTRERTYGSN
jgi:undecaprenyl diphosphate synthase